MPDQPNKQNHHPIDLPSNIKEFLNTVYAENSENPTTIENHRKLWADTLTGLQRELNTNVLIEDITLNDHLELRISRPKNNTALLPVVFYMPGGAFVYSDKNGHDPLCRNISDRNHCVVVNVNGPVSPEFTPTEALTETNKALIWCIANIHNFCGDSNNIVLAGDSSGGNFAALLAIEAAKKTNTNIKAQLLIVPATDLARTGQSHKDFDQGYMLDRVDWFYDFHLGPKNTRRIEPKDPSVSPLYADIPQAHVPTHIIIAKFDPLADDGRKYAEHLAEAGVEVTSKVIPALHGMHLLESAIDMNKHPQTSTITAIHTQLTQILKPLYRPDIDKSNPDTRPRARL